MSNIRRPEDKNVADALRDISKKLDEILRRINSGDVNFKKD